MYVHVAVCDVFDVRRRGDDDLQRQREVLPDDTIQRRRDATVGVDAVLDVSQRIRIIQEQRVNRVHVVAGGRTRKSDERGVAKDLVFAEHKKIHGSRCNEALGIAPDIYVCVDAVHVGFHVSDATHVLNRAYSAHGVRR